MYAKLRISGLSEAERAAQEILKHVEAIKEIQRNSSYNGAEIEIELKELSPASGN